MTTYPAPVHEDSIGTATTFEWDAVNGHWIARTVLSPLNIAAAGLLKAEDAAHASGDSGVAMLAVRRDTAVHGVSADGDYASLNVDANGRLHTTGPKPVKASTTALATSLIVKASAGRLFRAIITNTNAAARYFQVHNTTTLPADGVVPSMLIYVPATSTFVWDLGASGIAFATGITICNSTTAATKTIGTADAWIDAFYE